MKLVGLAFRDYGLTKSAVSDIQLIRFQKVDEFVGLFALKEDCLLVILKFEMLDVFNEQALYQLVLYVLIIQVDI